MRFNVVISNPPYNRGIDIDFVNLGYDLSTDYCVMITPAKWQTAEANQKIASKMSYGMFRGKIVPHMSKIDFVKCVPVFNSDSFECTIYSGFLVSANADDVMSNTHASGNYEFVVDNVKEAVGTVSSSGTLSLVERT